MLLVVGQEEMRVIKVNLNQCFDSKTILLFFVKDFIKNSDLMFKQSVYSTLLSASLANKFLKENGLLTLSGAAAALDTTPGLIKKENFLK